MDVQTVNLINPITCMRANNTVSGKCFSWTMTMAIISFGLMLLAAYIIYKFLRSEGSSMGFWFVFFILFLAMCISNIIMILVGYAIN